ncbi:energy transducer TonB [Qipengyuania flava]|uniref:energy transducer TonB n=2 Tax=Qipengyuania TaxID=1855416 RepID=UPI001C88BEEB|nr:energy transducer TonB [Qipengyuania aestuarii]MCA0979031.1 energy transducer TonB [Qipengyuania flava]
MAYADQQMSGNRVVAIIIVAIIHIALGYLLITGLAIDAVKNVVERVTTIDVEEPPPPPPPEDEPPPPPEDIPEPTSPPPPVSPPPPMNISPAPPTIRTTPNIPPPAPPTLRIPPPAPPAPPAPAPAPPAPSKARGASPDGLNRWAARIQGDYPSSALRREESGTVSMRITIGANGRVEACSVTGSSGSSALDDAACRGMQRYARYNPALNAAGDPISSTTTQSIRYVLPD